MLDANGISNRIGQAYREALADIQSQLDSIFRNFVGTSGISQAEAVRILNQIPIDRSKDITEQLRKAAELVEVPEDRAELLAKLNAPAYKYRMQCLKELAEDAGEKCSGLARTMKGELDGGLAEIVRDCYFRGVFDMQQGTGLAFSFSKISERKIKEILQQNWSGEHYSGRIWQNTDALADQLQQTLLKGVLTGASSGRMAGEIQERFHASYSRALTLTRTESSYCANSAELYRYKDTGVKKYRCVATLDTHTSQVCRELDGKEFPTEEAKPGKNYPPMHPRCRSTTIEALSPALMKKLERRARDPETGELRTVPGNMTYKEWYGEYVESGELTGEAESGIIKENKTTKHMQSELFSFGEKGNTGSDLFSAEARAKLSQTEKIIEEYSSEKAVVLSPDGTELFSKDGDADSVTFKEEECEKMKGCIVTHNHPNGSSFSPNDIVFMLNNNLSEIRVRIKGGTYILQRTSKTTKRKPKIKTVEKAFYDKYENLGNKYRDLAAQNGVSIVYYLRTIEEEVIIFLAQKYGLNFRLEVDDDG